MTGELGLLVGVVKNEHAADHLEHRRFLARQAVVERIVAVDDTQANDGGRNDAQRYMSCVLVGRMQPVGGADMREQRFGILDRHPA